MYIYIYRERETDDIYIYIYSVYSRSSILRAYRTLARSIYRETERETNNTHTHTHIVFILDRAYYERVTARSHALYI